MLTTREGEQQAHLTEWIWPLLADHSTPVQRMVIARLAALWLEQKPQAKRKELLASLILSIELRLAGKMGKE